MGCLVSNWPLGIAIAGFVAATLAIATSGPRLARTVDGLADRTGIGEALAGTVLLAGATSIAGLAVSVVAAGEGNASLAVSNSVGGIAAQTAMIVGADIAHRGTDLEHAAASLSNSSLDADDRVARDRAAGGRRPRTPSCWRPPSTTRRRSVSCIAGTYDACTSGSTGGSRGSRPT